MQLGPFEAYYYLSSTSLNVTVLW